MYKPEVYPVYQKIVVSGDYVERYQYEKPYHVGFPALRSLHTRLRSKTRDQELIRSDNVRRARQKIRRLINANPDLKKFMTLTFSSDVIDIPEGNKLFDAFIKRLKRLYPNLKYIAVPEFQKKSKRLHYHLLTNITEYISNDFLADELWQNGFAWLRSVYKIDNLGAYLSKYLSKEIFDKRYFKKKKFLYSLNLCKPIVLDYIVHVNKFLYNNYIDLIKPSFEGEFLTDFLGKVYYCRYKLDNVKVET